MIYHILVNKDVEQQGNLTLDNTSKKFIPNVMNGYIWEGKFRIDRGFFKVSILEMWNSLLIILIDSSGQNVVVTLYDC